jgi:hypothetical protein
MTRWAAFAYVVAACGPSTPSDKNPPVLYLAPLDNETQVQLVDQSPPPY